MQAAYRARCNAGHVAPLKLRTTSSFTRFRTRSSFSHHGSLCLSGRRVSGLRGQFEPRRYLSTAQAAPFLASPSSSTNDTIYALSTAPGRAAIAVIRVSGPACLDVYNGLCRSRPPKPRTATLRRLYEPLRHNTDTTSWIKAVLEPIILDSGALVLYFPSPQTATGEDLLELHVHGGPAIVKAVLQAIPRCRLRQARHTIRYADPGEFTRRAFYNSRIDLTQVEALGDVLSAETEQQRRLAVSGSESSLGKRYEEWRKMLLYARGELEALIDFSEDQHFDESPAEFMSSITKQVIQLQRQIELHITNASKGELLRSGINLALLGAPNAGKSSLLNRIVGREAAIVSSEAGTTRDIVDVAVDIGGWLCRLGDTAGLRTDLSKVPAELPKTTIGEIEKEGIRRARARALESDVIVAVLSFEFDAAGKANLYVDSEVASAIKECKEAGKSIVIAVNKIDMLDLFVQSKTTEAILASVKATSSPLLCRILEDLPASRIIPISCHEASSLATMSNDPGNIQRLLNTLTSTFLCLTTPSTTGADPDTLYDASYWSHSLSVSHRQATNLGQCLIHLKDFLSLSSPHHALGGQRPAEDEVEEIDIVAAAEHLRYAAECLGKITGRSDGGGGGGAGDVEEVLGVVFEKFCVGK